jgi:hypothetical protein
MKYVYATRVAFLVLFVFLFNIADCSRSKKESENSIDTAYKADLIIFSYDRPLQLYALLESVQKYMTGLSSTTVLYRASSADYEHAYNQVYADFPEVKTLKQGADPKADFKPLTLQAFVSGSSPYILFAVDDIIVTDHVCIAECSRALEDAQAYGFYLRLGVNLDYCYSMGGAQALPNFTRIITPTQIAGPPETIYSWCFAQGQHDWGYPHTVDMTVYRKKDVERDLQEMVYRSPNILEGRWYARASAVRHKCGLCFALSKIVNLPLNRVQHDYANRTMGSYSPAELLIK